MNEAAAVRPLLEATDLCQRGRGRDGEVCAAEINLRTQAARWAKGRDVYDAARAAELREAVQEQWRMLGRHIAECTDCRPKVSRPPRRRARRR